MIMTRAERREAQRIAAKSLERWNKHKPDAEERAGGWPEWTPFECLHIEDDLCTAIGCHEIWCNSRYQVQVRRLIASPGYPPMVHLSIKTHSKAPARDWRDYQRIKNELCGAEAEGVELYPAESRLMDEANQFHLYVIAPGNRFPFGEERRTVMSPEEIAADPQAIGARQRAFEAHHNARGCKADGLIKWR